MGTAQVAIGMNTSLPLVHSTNRQFYTLISTSLFDCLFIGPCCFSHHRSLNYHFLRHLSCTVRLVHYDSFLCAGRAGSVRGMAWLESLRPHVKLHDPPDFKSNDCLDIVFMFVTFTATCHGLAQ